LHLQEESLSGNAKTQPNQKTKIIMKNRTKTSMKNLLWAGICLALVGGPFGSTGKAQALIDVTGASADVTFYYDSVADTWATVFRAKGTTGQPTTTVASGLTAPFNSISTPATWTGLVGYVEATTPGHTGDYVYTTLTVQLPTVATLNVGPTTFFISPASGSPFFNPTDPGGTVPDIGIRTRLRENEVAMGSGSDPAANQFASFDMTLNLSASTWNSLALDDAGAPEVGLFHWDTFNNPVALINTDTSTLTANFGNYAHVHRNWGFSQYGNYSLVFDIAGVGGTYGATASTSSFTMNFNVIPEPSTGILLFGGLGLAALLRKRFLKKW
jgi:hypothetical protein